MSSGLKPASWCQDDLESQLNIWADRFGSQFILGLSGGGDSMALAVACAKWVASGKGHVHAVCVDHALRSDSAKEAQQTIAWAQALGLSAQVVTLNLKPGQTRVQERAREGRHAALCEAASAQGSRVILLAHTMNDQQETLALRLASKTGLDGLGGMAALAPSPFYRDDWPCLIGRPFLNTERDDLRSILIKAKQNWHEDPSNSNLAFARIRARTRLAALKAGGSNTKALNDIATQATNLRYILDAGGRAVIDGTGVEIAGNCISLPLGAITQSNAAIGERVLGWLAFSVAGAKRLPHATKTARLFQAIIKAHLNGATLAGAKFRIRGARLFVTLAPARQGKTQESNPSNTDIRLRLAAISGDLDKFVTHLG